MCKQKVNKEANSKHELYTLLCGVCDSSDNKIALTDNGIKVCYDCANWIKNRAKENGNLPHIQLNIDTKYMALNAT
jgi:hypothetical protein